MGFGRKKVRGSLKTPIQWAAELAHVREVSLLGTADLAFWKDRLTKEDLLPSEKDGQAQVMVVCADTKYMGVRFRELSFSVLVYRDNKGTGKDAAFLVRAFNSCRFFAFCERAFFSTPYQYGDVRGSASYPFCIRLTTKGVVVFQAEMTTEAAGPGREPSRRGEEGWEGPIFLPDARRGQGREGRLFFARIGGETQAYPFFPTQDFMTIAASDHEALQALRDSHFVAKEWIVRQDAAHAKSRTYKRIDVFP
jgi:hypothetical protein